MPDQLVQLALGQVDAVVSEVLSSAVAHFVEYVGGGARHFGLEV